MNYHELSLNVARALLESTDKAGSGGEPTASRRAPFSITISREAGALGHTVAAEVGRRLGWPVYDHELLDRIAAEMKRPTFHLRGMDERPVSWLEECLAGLLGENPVNATAYLKYLKGVVRGLGALGHSVIVGRGANCLLPAETTLRVRLVAALPDRVKVIAMRRTLSSEAAADWIAKTDRERSAFIKAYFGIDVADAHHYDLVVNTSRFSMEECSSVITEALQLFEERAAAKRESGRAPALVEPSSALP